MTVFFKAHFQKQHENNAMWYWWDISENSTAAEFSQAYHVWASTSHPRSLPPPLQLLFAPALVVRLAPHSSWNSTSLATLPRKNKMISYEPPFSHNNAKATRLANKLPQNEFIFPKFQADFISWDPARDSEFDHGGKKPSKLCLAVTFT